MTTELKRRKVKKANITNKLIQNMINSHSIGWKSFERKFNNDLQNRKRFGKGALNLVKL